MLKDQVRDNPVDEVADLAASRRASGDVAEDRKCMACGQLFFSDGWHNRLCGRCRKRSEPDGF